jgi:hypothetical protein
MKYILVMILSLALAFWAVPSKSETNNIKNSSVLIDQEEKMQEEEMKEEEPAKKETKKEEKKEETKKEEKKVEEMDKEPERLDDIPATASERMKFFREKYELNFPNETFEHVFKAITKSLEEKSCQLMKKTYNQNDQGFYKGTVISDYCIFAMGKDTTIDNLKLYSIAVPIIRGGVWTTGRFQYKFIIEEKEDGSVYFRIKGEVSGFESFVTESVHFWESNGYLETKMMERVKRHIEAKDY